MNLPTIVYRTPGTHHILGGTYDYLGVSTPEALDSALSGGWFRSIPEAVAGAHDEQEDTTAPTRAELEAKAKELDIAFDGRTTDRILAEKITAALAEQE